jgi:DNA-binding HxlR family transcriptional regulator
MTLFTALDGDIDPALLAFVKCHVTSPLKWEVLRLLVLQEGRWLRSEHLCRAIHHCHSRELDGAMSQLVDEGIVEQVPSGNPDDVSYRLPPSEPTTVVLKRLLAAATTSQELRGIIAAHLLRVRPRAAA